MIKSVSKHLKRDGFHNEIQLYIKQLVDLSCKENSRVILVINDIEDEISKFSLDYIESICAKSVTVLLRERVSRTISGEVKYSKNHIVPFPVGFCMLVGNESYIIVTGNNVTGFFNEPQSASLACGIIKKINKLFF